MSDDWGFPIGMLVGAAIIFAFMSPKHTVLVVNKEEIAMKKVENPLLKTGLSDSEKRLIVLETQVAVLVEKYQRDLKEK
jgi:hypothetical protein